MTVSKSNSHPQYFSPSSALHGTLQVPGDKSITHRAILLGLLAEGETEIDGWLDAADCRSSLRVARSLGARVNEQGNALQIRGVGSTLKEPEDVLDCGNSGTTLRVFMGALAARVGFACITGDDSLRRRPMGRVIQPLREMGAQIAARSGNVAPLCVQGGNLHGIEYTLPVASAQVKSAILVAGLLATKGTTTIVEQTISRDHTENMMAGFGVQLHRDRLPEGGQRVTVSSGQPLHATRVQVPGDISSAAFHAAAALMVPGSTVTLLNVGLNPTRTGFLNVIRRMGGNMTVTNRRESAGEAMGDLTVRASTLRGVEIHPEEIPTLIDELPVIAVLAAFAQGTTRIYGADELRYKETDRIAAMVSGLRTVGGTAEETEDGFIVQGKGSLPGGRVSSYGDHRVAMSFAVAGLASQKGVEVDDWNCVDISYPRFLMDIHHLGYTGP